MESDNTVEVIEITDGQASQATQNQPQQETEEFEASSQVTKILFSKYFKIISQAEGSTQGTCLKCNNIYKAKTGVSSNFMKHLQVSFIREK